jgi:hypothetical protein
MLRRKGFGRHLQRRSIPGGRRDSTRMVRSIWGSKFPISERLAELGAEVVDFLLQLDHAQLATDHSLVEMLQLPVAGLQSLLGLLPCRPDSCQGWACNGQSLLV